MKRGLVTILFIAVQSCSYAGGWIQKYRSGYFQLSERATFAGKWFNELHTKTSIRTISNYTSSFYGEYGISKKITGVAYVPFFVRNTLNATVGQLSGKVIEEGSAYNGIGDVNIGAKYGIITEGNTVMNIGLTLGLPVGNNTHESLLFTGDGEFNQILKVEAARSFGPVYSVIGVGFNNRTKGFSDDFRYDFEIGYSFNKFTLISKIAGVESFFNGNPRAGGDNTGLFANNLEYLNVGGEFVYKMNEQWGIATGGSVPVTGHKVLAGPTFGIAVYYKHSSNVD